MSRLIPRGAVVAGLGKRFLAAVIDAAPPVILILLMVAVWTFTSAPTASLVAFIVGGLLLAGYGLYQWWAYGVRGAGIGARVMGLRLVSLRDGEPIGWWRFFLRHLVFSALMGTVIGGIALLVFLVIHERRQGWHDLASGAVLVELKASDAPAKPRTASTPRPGAVGLPPHLASSFSPQSGTSSPQTWGSYAPPQTTQAYTPDWLPGVESEPLNRPVGDAPRRQAPPERGPESQPTPYSPPPSPISLPEGGPKPLQQNWIPLPTPSSVIEPSIRMRRREFGEVEEDEGTRIAKVPGSTARAGDEGWYVRLDDGREVDLTVPVLLGRNPQKKADDPAEVHLVPASGDGRMISRTHVLIDADPRGVVVVDRGSTNGTALVSRGGELEPCPTGTRVRVREGQQVSYGNRWFTVLRRPVL